jgi:hypothetical protein
VFLREFFGKSPKPPRRIPEEIPNKTGGKQEGCPAPCPEKPYSFRRFSALKAFQQDPILRFWHKILIFLNRTALEPSHIHLRPWTSPLNMNHLDFPGKKNIVAYYDTTISRNKMNPYLQ